MRSGFSIKAGKCRPSAHEQKDRVCHEGSFKAQAWTNTCVIRRARQVAVGSFAGTNMQADDFRHQGMRRQLVELLKKKGIRSERVLGAIGKVARHQFIEDTAFERFAYEDHAFPIGCGQTISQPYTVAVQSELLEVKQGDKVLEIGTGCGYQTAVLCEMGAKVYSIERHRPLYLATKARLSRMGYRAELFHGDGYKGLPVHAPFNKIIVTCGAPEVPPALLDQLIPNGLLVIPVGIEGKQTMVTVARAGNDLVRREHGAFSFVPMVEKKVGG
jgi:protein-L-isoaspartate(D-aspartate) O-methyltransferase